MAKFNVVFGVDMETDVGSYTDHYTGIQNGMPKLLELFAKHGVKATCFWTAHAATHNPEMVKKVIAAGHETGCHSLEHETLGDPLFPLPNNWPVRPYEVEKRIEEATQLVEDIAGIHPTSFRCPRLWGSTKVVNVLEKLGYKADASLPLFFYRTMFRPYHPDANDWTREGQMKLVEIPNFCDLAMESNDPWQRDRDQWPLFRTEGAQFMLDKVDGFIKYVTERGVDCPTLCFYIHPWEFAPMPQGAIDLGEADVIPKHFIVKNCGDKAVEELDKVLTGLTARGGVYMTAGMVADEYR